MGTKFELISDDSLAIVKYTDTCSFCGKSEHPIYSITGFKIMPGEYVFSEVPEDMENTEMDCACKECISSGNIKPFSEWEVEDVIKKYSTNPENEILKLRKTPSIPLFLQSYDWVVCCGELCEFTGVPSSYEESIQIGEEQHFWHKGPQNWKTFWSFEFTLEPEDLDEVSKFQCKKCKKNGLSGKTHRAHNKYKQPSPISPQAQRPRLLQAL